METSRPACQQDEIFRPIDLACQPESCPQHVSPQPFREHMFLNHPPSDLNPQVLGSDLLRAPKFVPEPLPQQYPFPRALLLTSFDSATFETLDLPLLSCSQPHPL